MAWFLSESSDIPPRADLFSDNAALHEYLQIQPPEAPATSPPILSFSRKREVQIPWQAILADMDISGATSIAALRAYFEASWPFDEDVEQLLMRNADAMRLIQGDPPLVDELKPPPAGEAPKHRFWRTAFDAEGAARAEPVTEGVVIRHASTGRWYLATPVEGEVLAAKYFSGKLYGSAWEMIDTVELIFDQATDATTYYTAFEEVDLRPAVIERKYQELDILLRYAQQVKQNVQAVTQTTIQSIVQAGLDSEEIERLQQRALRLELGEVDVQRQRQRLAAQAAQLGFKLPLGPEKEKVTPPDQDTKELEPGKLYTPYQRIARWTTRYQRPRKVVRHSWFFGVPYTATEQVDVTVHHQQLITDYTPVNTSRDLLSSKREALSAEGLQVFVFEQTPAGFATADGTRLRTLMERCKFDEAFRRRCAVLLPVYESALTGERLIAKYSVFKRPQPGLLPTMLPRLSIVESLTYRTAWRQTLLGELVSSINLAPGEERKVTITKRFEHETTVSRSSTSIFDVSRSESTDLATEMENQTRQEQESSSNLSFSTKASASYGLFSAEASANGGTSSSLKDVSAAIAKVAKKAAQSVSQQNREEVTSTSTARTTVSNTDETVATIRNINEGRTLNLMFYRLYNKFSGGLYLEGLGFDVIPGVEVIAGSGVHESVSFGLDALPELLEQLTEAQLPFAIPEGKAGLYRRRILDTLRGLICDEYAVDCEPRRDRLSAGAAAPAAPTSVARLRLPGPPVARTASADGSRPPGDEHIDADLEAFAAALRGATLHSDEPMAPQDLLVAAPGLYLDAMVGLRPSTELYSEEMRKQQVRMRAAEVYAKESEAVFQRAQAARLSRLRPGAGDGSNWLTGIVPDVAEKTLSLMLRYPPGPGEWWVLVDGERQGQVTADGSQSTVSLSLGPEAGAWLAAPDLVTRIELFDEATQTAVRFAM